MKSLNKIILITFSCFALNVSASELTVTCGKNAYEAIDESKLDQAEFSAVLKLKGLNNPPVLKRLVDDGKDLLNSVRTLTHTIEEGVTEIKIEMKGFSRYEITGLKGCADLDESTGKVTYFKNTGGFAGVRRAGSALCNCVKK